MITWRARVCKPCASASLAAYRSNLHKPGTRRSPGPVAGDIELTGQDKTERGASPGRQTIFSETSATVGSALPGGSAIMPACLPGHPGHGSDDRTDLAEENLIEANAQRALSLSLA